MKRLLFLMMLWSLSTTAQISFPYEVQLTPKELPDLPGIHSYAYAQHDGYWVILGGRTDGLHARQPFNAFPSSDNNDAIFVVDYEGADVWSASIDQLPSALKEQLRSSNMNFHQEGDYLVLLGGYAYSETVQDHITFPYLTAVHVPTLMDEVMQNALTEAPFQQVENDEFAITGAQLNVLDEMFYLVGGHRFDGRYNPMGMPTYTQTYSNEIRRFQISFDPLEVTFESSISDAVHLHRRDYNLMPEVKANGDFGLMISSGVFQTNADLPYLYPVFIDEEGITPETGFNQYLSNYHSAHASLLNTDDNSMHHLFFGGMSQYFYQNGVLMQDDLVPFVNTISRLERREDGIMEEFVMSASMPNLKGSSAEFIPLPQESLLENDVLVFDENSADTLFIGHIVGGIQSEEAHAFSFNNTGVTSADDSVYEVRLVRSGSVGMVAVPGQNDFSFKARYEPDSQRIALDYQLELERDVRYFLTNVRGELIQEGKLGGAAGENQEYLRFSNVPAQGTYFLTLSLDHVFFNTEQIFIAP